MDKLLLGTVLCSTLLAISFVRDVTAFRPKELQIFIIFGICSAFYLYIINNNGFLDTVKEKWQRLVLLLLPLIIGKIFFGIRYRFFRKKRIESAMTIIKAVCSGIGFIFGAVRNIQLPPKDLIVKYAEAGVENPSQLLSDLVAYHMPKGKK